VLLLHELGGNSDQEGWDELALKLQPHYAVLRFDLRGHGESTEVVSGADGFWSVRDNWSLAGADVNKATIKHQNFPRNGLYHPMLVNDIAAARLFLDRCNNAGQCNSSNLVVIGAGEGATLGAIWIASEWHRRPVIQNALGLPIDQDLPAGRNISAAIWLSISRSLGRQRIPIENLLTRRSPEAAEKIPMYFLYDAGDAPGARTSQQLVDALKKGARRNRVDHLTGARSLGQRGLAGRELLLRGSYKTDEFILRYLKKVFDDRGENASLKQPVTRSPFPVPVQRLLQ
jgi:pimeloyl-ACP methyl ester carboxylesterase